MNPEEYLELAKERSDEISEIYNEQNRMARILFESMKMNGVIQVSQGPTGMGKTLVILHLLELVPGHKGNIHPL